ncbi:GL15132 [Drosophila persimilis]|uniref:GL15132 n=1 Tax=Drosophila persimilis TaxID=7234 RepID=B4H3W3_DROPE|nr:GL15132 [Drosophila persimilis]
MAGVFPQHHLHRHRRAIVDGMAQYWRPCGIKGMHSMGPELQLELLCWLPYGDDADADADVDVDVDVSGDGTMNMKILQSPSLQLLMHSAMA